MGGGDCGGGGGGGILQDGPPILPLPIIPKSEGINCSYVKFMINPHRDLCQSNEAFLIFHARWI